MVNIGQIGFGGGCHWCTEAVFQSLKGVVAVEQGFMASEGIASSFSEAVLVKYDAKDIGLEDLIQIHLHTHHSTSSHTMRKKYRSAIYTFSETDTERSKNALWCFKADFEKAIITEVLPFVTFKSSDPRFHDYYFKEPQKPFCKAYITPKLKILMERFSNMVDQTKFTDPL